MQLIPWVRLLHLIAAATWLGGLITLGALVVSLRKAGAERSLLQAAARGFARVSWVAMTIAVATGLLQVFLLKWPWVDGKLHTKITLVVVAIGLALAHQLTARKTTAKTRGMIQGAILLVSLAIYGVAVFL